MIHLVGIWHSFQTWGRETSTSPPIPNPRTDRFADYLRARAADLKPSVICEEAVEDWLHFQVTVAETVAAERRIEHVFCDPDSREREEIFRRAWTTSSRDNEAGFPIREKFWLDRLHAELGYYGVRFKTIIFVCGFEHVPTFGVKLKRADIPFAVCCANLAEEWGFRPHSASCSRAQAQRPSIWSVEPKSLS